MIDTILQVSGADIAGPIDEGQTVELRADLNGLIVTNYTWSLSNDGGATYQTLADGPALTSAEFIPTDEGVYTFKLEVTLKAHSPTRTTYSSKMPLR